jgi:hypothetical protein
MRPLSLAVVAEVVAEVVPATGVLWGADRTTSPTREIEVLWDSGVRVGREGFAGTLRGKRSLELSVAV